MKQTLIPRTKIQSEGKVGYSESFQAWNIIRLKKELFEEFPQLKEKRSKFSYELVYYKDIKDLEKTIKQLIKNKAVLPLLLFLYRETN